MVLSVQFTAPTSTLADQDGVAQLLVEGTFSPDAALTVNQEELPQQGVDGYTSRSAWSYSVTGSQSDTITVRLRADGVKKPAAAVYQDGRWQRVDSTQDGSYLVFQASTQGQVLLLEERSLPLLAVGLIGGGVIVLLLAGFFLHRHLRSKKTASSAKE